MFKFVYFKQLKQFHYEMLIIPFSNILNKIIQSNTNSHIRIIFLKKLLTIDVDTNNYIKHLKFITTKMIYISKLKTIMKIIKIKRKKALVMNKCFLILIKFKIFNNKN